MKTTLLAVCLIWISVDAFTDPINLDELSWPRDIKLKKGLVTVYQPQIEIFSENKLEARAALAVKLKDQAPVFGAMWFTSRVATDRDQHLVVFDQITVESLKFPEGEEESVEKLKKVLTEKLSGMSLTMSLDRFTASIEHLEDFSNTEQGYENAPPRIYFETDPAVLVFIDGEPILKEIENSGYKYVMNTPYFMLQGENVNKFYLKGGEWWYTSSTITQGWTYTKAVPDEVNELAKQAFQGETTDVDSMIMQMDNPPKVIVSTEPAELIQTDGEPKFEPVTGTNLLFLTNSESDIIMDIDTQLYYILISGRWYQSKVLENGSWSFVNPGELPSDFEKIPEASGIADVRYSVPGTREAKDAMLENAIPQTAEVDRKKASVEVQYDGNPKFTKIESTSVSYAENADKTTLLINQKYYCVDDAVWFVSNNATGPWEVCVDVPDEVREIPPSSPVYNVRYVYVYDYTPSVVYVGYTPGYYGSYVYRGTVIYGTGYWYRPWYHTYYYPRPVTWGFGIHYNPWTGWGFSYGVSYGWISFGWHSYYRGWWGPCGYRYGYRHGYYRGYQHGYRHGYRYGYAAGRRAGYVASNRPSTREARSSNIYRNKANGVRNTGVRTAARPSTREIRPTTRPTNPSRETARPSTRPETRENNVYSDRNGNIYRRDNSGNWQQRNNGQWSNRSNQSPTPANMNRDFQNRNYGNNRANSYSNRANPPAAPRSRQRGGMR